MLQPLEDVDLIGFLFLGKFDLKSTLSLRIRNAKTLLMPRQSKHILETITQCCAECQLNLC